jgi:peptidoglycan L-alanyl-D-glutamate endopeptidase CwlK
MMPSRKIEDLLPELQIKYFAFKKAMNEAGIDYIVTATRRTQQEQDALYAQGRTKPGKKVTWTRKSKHIDGKAFDICIMENGKPDWDVSNPDWRKAGEIGIKAGLDWGGLWDKPDFPHFQIG